ncbi:MAG TPA: hypothetical protein VH113_03215 [Gemmatimonadales bacterium]|nr:hypothetical protein [Gemmatimonadales bacterium]
MPSFAPLRRVAAVGLLGLAAATCTRELDAPGRSVRLELAPRFAPQANPPGNALAIDQVRAQVVRHSTAEVVFDKTYPFATGSSLQLGLTFALSQPTDTFDVFLDYQRGAQTLFSGSQSIPVFAGATPAPVPLPVFYVGPGLSATSIAIAPRDTILTSGDPLQLRLTVLDTATPDSIYVGWGTNVPSQAVDANGHLVAAITRGTVTVRAVSPTPPGLRDSTTIHIVPKPSSVVKVSGDGQTGTASQPLPLPLVVQVNGADHLGVPGVAVTFASLSGGSVDTALVVTDSLGRASTGVTLGPSTGAQSFSATAGTLSVTFGASGSAVPPKTWTGAVSNDWNTGGNWNPAGVPGATDSVIVPSGTANSAVIRGGLSYSVNGLFIQSGATVTMDTASLLVNGSFTQAGTFVDPSASSALSLQGTTKTLTGTIPILSTTVTGSYTLAGNVQAQTLSIVGTLTLGGHTLTTTTQFQTVGSGRVVLSTASDTLFSQGTMSFGGGAEGGFMTAGTVIVSGNFIVTGNNAYHAGVGVTTIFNGSAPQTLTMVDSTSNGGFDALDFRNTAGVQISAITFVGGSVTLEANAVVTSNDTTINGQGLIVNQNVTTLAGSRLHVGRLYLGGTINAAPGTYAVTATIFDGAGQLIPVGPTYPFLYSTGNGNTLQSGTAIVTQLAVQGGSLTLSGNFSFPGNTFVQFGGTLIPNGHTLSVGGAFTANNSGLLKMTNSLDTLIVGGSALFQGGNESGLLTAGGISVGADFSEGSGDAQAFASTGTAVMMASGGAPHISFGHPGGSGASHFYDLGIANGQGALTIQSDVFVLHQAVFLGGVPKIVHGGGQTVHFANLTMSGVVFDNVAIAYDAALGGANLIALDSVTFENYNINSATPLITIVSPGNTGSPGTPFLFSALSFLTNISANAGSGHYLSVTNTGAAGALIIDVTANLPAGEGLAHTVQVGSPTVSWP